MGKNIITVFGATGNQGGSVARSLVKNPAFHVRGLTRNSDSDASKSLASMGIEMVQTDGFSSDQMKIALRDTWGLFLNINSDDKV